MKLKHDDLQTSIIACVLILVCQISTATGCCARDSDLVRTLSGFPDAATAGVPVGTVLAPTQKLIVNVPHTVVTGVDVKGSVVINANYVTLKNCKVTSSDYVVVLVKPGIVGALVQNCEIDNLGAGGQGIAGQGTFVANDIHGCADGIDVRGNDTVIRENYIHGMRGTPDSHLDGIQADGGFSNLTIEHNSVINEQVQNSALMLDNYWGPINRVVINNNLLFGGGYTVFINEVANGQFGGGPVTNVSFTNNFIGGGGWGNLSLKAELGNTPFSRRNVNISRWMLERFYHKRARYNEQTRPGGRLDK